MIRASLRYVTAGDRKLVVASLRDIYTADTEEAAVAALDAFDKRWLTKYPSVSKLWRSRWNEFTPFLAFPKEIRTILYTTNVIESLNFQLRRVLRPKRVFNRNLAQDDAFWHPGALCPDIRIHRT